MTQIPALQRRDEQIYLAIRCEITDGIRSAVDRAFPALFGWLAEHAVQPAGPPFIRYHELDRDDDPLVIEVGAPVSDAAASAADGTVTAGALPAGRYAVLVHVGPYSHETERDLADVRDDLTSWIDAQQFVFRRPSDRGWSLPCAYESYRLGPVDTDDWTRWETDMAYLVD